MKVTPEIKVQFARMLATWFAGGYNSDLDGLADALESIAAAARHQSEEQSKKG